MLMADNRLLTPIMSAMIELPLPLPCVQVNFLLFTYVIFHVLNNLLLIYICKLHWNQLLVSVAESAVSIADGDDLPLLLRTLIRCMDLVSSASLGQRLKVGQPSHSSNENDPLK